MSRPHRKNLTRYNKARIKDKGKAEKKSAVRGTDFDYVKSAWLAGAKIKVNIKQKRYKIYANR